MKRQNQAETTLCIRIELGDENLDVAACEELAERVVAEAMDCGLLGVVEESGAGVAPCASDVGAASSSDLRAPRSELLSASHFGAPQDASSISQKPCKVLLLYVLREQASALREIVASVVGTHGVVCAAQSVEDQDWSTYWARDFAPIEVSPQLVICPSFVACPTKAGQKRLTIDPGQAFGTGRHESTFLALQALDSLHAVLGSRTTVLDVGTGSGVLALAALLLGAGHATGFDIDPLSPPAAFENAQKNGLADRFEVFAGTHESLVRGRRYALVLANMLRTETEPLLEFIAERVAFDGRVVFSGLLASERERFTKSLAAVGLIVEREFVRADADGIEWLGLIVAPAVA